MRAEVTQRHRAMAEKLCLAHLRIPCPSDVPKSQTRYTVKIAAVAIADTEARIAEWLVRIGRPGLADAIDVGRYMSSSTDDTPG